MFGATHSGRIYKNEGSTKLETSPLISPPHEGEEELTNISPINVINLIKKRILHIPTPPTPPLVSPSSPPTSPIPPPPPLQSSMANAIKLPVFKGVGNEDPYQF